MLCVHLEKRALLQEITSQLGTSFPEAELVPIVAAAQFNVDVTFLQTSENDIQYAGLWAIH